MWAIAKESYLNGCSGSRETSSFGFVKDPIWLPADLVVLLIGLLYLANKKKKLRFVCSVNIQGNQ